MAYVANNPNARYVTAGSGALANGGRNTFPLFPINNIDLAVKKRLQLQRALLVRYRRANLSTSSITRSGRAARLVTLQRRPLPALATI